MKKARKEPETYTDFWKIGSTRPCQALNTVVLSNTAVSGAQHGCVEQHGRVGRSTRPCWPTRSRNTAVLAGRVEFLTRFATTAVPPGRGEAVSQQDAQLNGVLELGCNISEVLVELSLSLTHTRHTIHLLKHYTHSTPHATYTTHNSTPIQGVLII